MAETASKSTHNWWRYPSRECYEIDKNVRFGISRAAVSTSDAADAQQLHSFRCTTAPKMIRKIYLLYEFWCTQSCSFLAIFPVSEMTYTVSSGTLNSSTAYHPSHFWTTDGNTDSCCQRCIATCRKKFISVHIFVPGSKVLRRIFFKFCHHRL